MSVKFSVTPPTVAGYWILPGSWPGSAMKIAMPGKPSWLRRTAMWLVLGFKWEDA